MDIGSIAQWIEQRESLLSGIAAAVAIGGVTIAGLRIVLQRLSRRATVVGATGAPVLPDAAPGPSVARAPRRQDIRFCTSADGVRIAWARVGEGPPLVRALGWVTNLEMEWQHENSRWIWERFAESRTVVRYDGRGMGLSERQVSELSPATRLADLEAVVDAADLQQFDLLGLSEGGVTAIAYAARHPQRVRRLVLYGTFLKIDWDTSPIRALLPLVPRHWGTDNKAFHQMFTTLWLSAAQPEDIRFFNELQRSACSGEMASRMIASLGQTDVIAAAASLRMPVLVIHGKGDMVIPVAAGQRVAATIPGATLELVDASNHLMWFDSALRQRLLDSIQSFLY